MSTFLNEELKSFNGLSPEEMFAIVAAKQEGLAEVYNASMDEWLPADVSSISLHEAYRTKPKQLVVPWDVLRDDIVCVAMDRNGLLYGYTKDIKQDTCSWLLQGDTYCLHNLNGLKIDTSGVDWRESKVMRPVKEGV